MKIEFKDILTGLLVSLLIYTATTIYKLDKEISLTRQELQLFKEEVRSLYPLLQKLTEKDN